MELLGHMKYFALYKAFIFETFIVTFVIILIVKVKPLLYVRYHNKWFVKFTLQKEMPEVLSKVSYTIVIIIYRIT